MIIAQKRFVFQKVILPAPSPVPYTATVASFVKIRHERHVWYIPHGRATKGRLTVRHSSLRIV